MSALLPVSYHTIINIVIGKYLIRLTLIQAILIENN